MSIGENASTEEEMEIEHEFDQSLPIISHLVQVTIEFMLDFFDLTDEKELLHFCVIYFAAVAAEAEEEAEVAEIAAWAEETASMGEVD